MSAAPEWRADTSLFDALGSAAIATDLDGVIFYWNSAAEELYGYSRTQMLGANVMHLLVPAESQVSAGEIMEQVLGGRRWTGEFRVRCADGSSRSVQITDSPLWRDGEVVGVLGVAEDGARYQAARSALDVLSDRLTRLARATAELASARDVAGVADVVVVQAAGALGAGRASLSLLIDEQTLKLVGFTGSDETTALDWASYSLDASVPVATAVRTRRPVVVTGSDELAARFPDAARVVHGEWSIVAVPLVVGDRTLGAIGLSFRDRRAFDEQEMEFFTALADTCAQALDRVQALADSAEQSARLRFLADASAELSSSLDYRVTLGNVARLAVPTLADWCAVQIVEEGRLHHVAVAHTDPAKVTLAAELSERYPADPESPAGAPNVARTGVSELIAEITDEMLVAAARDEEHLQLARDLQLRSALTVPLVARGRVLGVISLVWAESGRRYGPADLAFAEDLASRAAVAIDNAHLHSETRDIAARLQKAVSPGVLPEVPGWSLAGEYRQAGRTDVGGDFYDVVVLGDGRLGLFVGDVMGRGVAAAAGMAQVRAALRAYVAVDPDPARVMTQLDQMFQKFDIAQLVTVVYLVIDPGQGELTMVNAGHVPPVIVRADGHVDHLPPAQSPPFGAGSYARLPVTLSFSRGETLLAFTDGLVERRFEDIDIGLKRLGVEAESLAIGELAPGLLQLVDALHDPTREDDVAALAVRQLPLT